MFFQIPERDIKNMLNHAGILPQLNKLYRDMAMNDEATFCGKEWSMLEKPESSILATWFTLFSIITIIISIASTVAETSFKIESKKLSENIWLQLGE